MSELETQMNGILVIKRSGHLSYLTRTNIENLIKLEIESEYGPSYPHFSKNQIEYLIKEHIGVDQKTINLYRECLRTFISTKYKIKDVPYNNWNLNGLYESLKLERERTIKGSIIKNQNRKLRADLKHNSRQRCKNCRGYIRLDKTCDCKIGEDSI